MTQDKRTKAQAVFLSMLMILSIFGGSLAFAGTAAAANDASLTDGTNGGYVAPGDTGQVVQEFTVTDSGNGDSGSTDIDSITVTNPNGDATSSDIDSISVYYETNGDGFDGTQTESQFGSTVSSSIDLTNGVTFGGSDSGSANVNVADGSSVTFYVVVDVASGATETAKFDTTSTVDLTSGSTSTFSSGSTSSVSASAVTEVDAAPTITSATTADTDNNGQIDQLKLTFSEAVDINDGTSGDGISGLSIDESAYSIKSADYGATGVTGVTLDISESSSPDTGVTPSVSYSQGAGGITDADQQNLDHETVSFTSTDGASPTIISATTADTDGNGQIDQVTVTFSEGVTSGSTEASDYSIGSYSGVTISGDDNGDSTLVFSVTESGSSDTGATPTVSYSQSGSPDTKDSSGNLLADGDSVTANDGANPADTGASITSVSVVGDEQKYTEGETIYVEVTYSESVTVDETGGTPTLAIGVASASYESGSGSNTLNFSYTVQDGDNGDIVIGDITLNGGTIKDAAGNDASTATSTQGLQTASVDTTEPSINSFTAGYSSDSNTVTVTVVADETLENESIEAELRDENGNVVTTLTSWSPTTNANEYEATYTPSDSINATYSVNLTAADDPAGNGVVDPSLSNDSVAIDTAALDLTIDSPTSPVNVTSEDTLDVQYSYSDTNPDTVKVILTGNGETYTYVIDDSQYADDNTQKSITVDLSEYEEAGDTLVDGSYTVTVKATDDSSGTNSTTTSEALVTVDDASPTFDVFNVEDKSSTTTNFTQTVSDGTTGVDETSIVVRVTQDGDVTTLDVSDSGVSFQDGTIKVVPENVNALSLSDGEVTVNYTVSDFSGNSKTSANQKFTINSGPPAIESVEAEAGSDEVTVHFTEPVKADDGTFSKDDFAYTDVSGDGANHITGVSANTGNDEFTTSVTLTLDSEVAASDIGVDEVNAQEGALTDTGGDNAKSIDASTVAIDDTTDPVAPDVTAGNITAENQNTYTVTVTTSGDVATVDVVLKNEDGEVFAENTSVDITSGTANVEFDATNLADGDVTVETTVYDRGKSSLTSSTSTQTVKDSEAATFTAKTDAGTDTVTLNFSEPVTNVEDNLVFENLSDSQFEKVSATVYEITLDGPVAPSDLNNESVTISSNGDIEDVVGTDADTSEVQLTDEEDPSVVSAITSNGTDTVTVHFSEDVFNGSDEGLSAENFTYVDNSGEVQKVESVEHDAGSQTAEVTLNTSVTADDLNEDAIEATFSDSVDNEVTDSATLSASATITEFTVTNETDHQVKISFTSTEELESFEIDAHSGVHIAEGDSVHTTLTMSDATVTENADGTFTYVVTTTAPRDGSVYADLESATAVGDSHVSLGASYDEAVVDYEDPHPVDAEITDYNGSVTNISVQFNEPVGFYGDTNHVSIDGVDNSRILDVRETDTNEFVILVDGAVQTGDSPQVSFEADAYGEDYGDSTGTDAGTTVNTLELSLSEGANFMSVPAASGDLNVSEVVNQLGADNVETIMTYDDGEWQYYNPDKEGENPFDTIEGGQGYIVKLSSGAELEVNVYNVAGGDSAEDSTPQATELEEGWNLVGQWQEGSQSTDAALASVSDGTSDATAVYGQANAGGYTYTEVQDFEPGEAYWVFVTEDTVYTESQEELRP